MAWCRYCESKWGESGSGVGWMDQSGFVCGSVNAISGDIEEWHFFWFERLCHTLQFVDEKQELFVSLLGISRKRNWGSSILPRIRE